MKTLLTVVTIIISLAFAFPPLAAAADEPGIMLGDAMVVTATVEAVDKADRTVTLRGPGGDAVTIEVDKDVRNFDQIKVGDDVNMEYYQSVAVFIGKPGSGPAAVAGTAVARAPKGEKPGGVAVETLDVIAVIRAIDRDDHTVTIQGPHGNLTTLDVDASVKNFDQLKVGDTVHAQYTEAIAIWVSKAKPSATVDIDEVQVAFMASGNLGKGTMDFQGKTYPFELGGLGVGGIGISTIKAVGDVYNLQSADDLAGVYGQLRVGLVVANKSAGRLWLKNTKGVMISLRDERKGLMLSIGGDGVVIKMK